MVTLVSFAVGTMLGAVFLHLLPEAIERRGSGSSTALLTLLGFVLFFTLERWLDRQRQAAAAAGGHAEPRR